jgi:hypothetical protein
MISPAGAAIPGLRLWLVTRTGSAKAQATDKHRTKRTITELPRQLFGCGVVGLAGNCTPAENCMKRILVVLTFSLLAFAQSYPITATCPYDGETASIEKTVGIGKDRVCWYGHQRIEHEEDGSPKFTHHSFYQSCPAD